MTAIQWKYILFGMISKGFPSAWALILIILLISCPVYKGHEILRAKGTIPDTVSALTGANGPYDDYNSGPPQQLAMHFPLYFSSNRATQGGTFDVESVAVHISFDQSSGWFSLDSQPLSSSPWQSLNSSSNECGPFYAEVTESSILYLFASDRNGGLDVFYALDEGGGPGPAQEAIALNSVSDEAYPSLFGPDGSLYFSSNQNGEYDIFSAPVPAGQDIAGFLGTSGASIMPADPVNSSSDDKAPFISGKLMVFASNRPGGYGGYDLWYSIYGGEGWSSPVNFGDTVNTASDEFRPVVIPAPDFTNDLIIFSSDRPGGMGGFDLYYVGVPKMTE